MKQTLAKDHGISTDPEADGTSREGVMSELAGGVSDVFNMTSGNYQGAYIDKDGNFHQRICFVAGTKIKTKDGYKAIETVKAGDIVVSANQHTGEVSYKTVKETYIRQAPRIFKLTYSNSTTVETTGNHPFYVEGKGWTNADNLVTGDITPTKTTLEKNGGITGLNGVEKSESISVVGIDVKEEETSVYNFEVEDHHTYFVAESEVWVHNQGKRI